MISSFEFLTALDCWFYSVASVGDTVVAFQCSLSLVSPCIDASFSFPDLLCCSTSASSYSNLSIGSFLL